MVLVLVNSAQSLGVHDDALHPADVHQFAVDPQSLGARVDGRPHVERAVAGQQHFVE